MKFQRSTNGGVTWQSPVAIPNWPDIRDLDVDTNGNVFVGGEGKHVLLRSLEQRADRGPDTLF